MFGLKNIETERMAALERGARIVVYHWMQVKPWDRLLIVTTKEHAGEAEVLRYWAEKKTSTVNIFIAEETGRCVGVFFDWNEEIFDSYTAVIAATDYSLVTTKAARRAIKQRKKFLSLPLFTNDERSMLEYDFITMDTKKSRVMAKVIMKYLKNSSKIHITTPAGTNLQCYKVNRIPGFFNGVVKDGKGFSSASIEVYVPIEETKSEGVLVVDGSLGYIGCVREPTKVVFREGRIVEIEETLTGKVLRQYMDDYHDPRIYVGGEFGIGLNSNSCCVGNCYIEDESAYGTFHIGLGRNLALGGCQEANGHFDLVCLEPDIYTDNRQIMQQGKIIVPEPVDY